jgi:hypothetical protein
MIPAQGEFGSDIPAGGGKLANIFLRCSEPVRVHTEWKLLISGVYPFMMEKSALAGEVGGCTPAPFQPITITYKVAMHTLQLSGQIHSPCFIYTPPICTLCADLSRCAC